MTTLTHPQLQVPSKHVLIDGTIERTLARVGGLLDEAKRPLTREDWIVQAAVDVSLISDVYSIRGRHARYTHGALCSLRFCLAAAILQQETAWVDAWLIHWARFHCYDIREVVHEVGADLITWLGMLSQLPDGVQAKLCAAEAEPLRRAAALLLSPADVQQRQRLLTLRRDRAATVWAAAQQSLTAHGLLPLWMGPLPDPLPPHIAAAPPTATEQAALEMLTTVANAPGYELSKALIARWDEVFPVLSDGVAAEVAFTLLNDPYIGANDALYRRLVGELCRQGESVRRLCVELIAGCAVVNPSHDQKLRWLKGAVDRFTTAGRAAFCHALSEHFEPSAWVSAINQAPTDDAWQVKNNFMSLLDMAEKLWLPDISCRALVRACEALPEGAEDHGLRVALLGRMLPLMWTTEEAHRDHDALVAFAASVGGTGGTPRKFGIVDKVASLLNQEEAERAWGPLWRDPTASADLRRDLFVHWIFPAAEGTPHERFDAFCADPATRSLLLASAQHLDLVALVRAARQAGVLTEDEATSDRYRALMGSSLVYRSWELSMRLDKTKQLDFDPDNTDDDNDFIRGLWGSPSQPTPEDAAWLRSQRATTDRSEKDYWSRALLLSPVLYRDETDEALLDEAWTTWRADASAMSAVMIVAVVLRVRGAQALLPHLDLIWERALQEQKEEDASTLFKVCFLAKPSRFGERYLKGFTRGSNRQWEDL